MNSDSNAGIAGHPNDDTTSAIKQNMKMLLLTRKGEYSVDRDWETLLIKTLLILE